MTNDLLRSLPSIERLLKTPAAGRAARELGRERSRDLLREITDELRKELSEARSSEFAVPNSEDDTSDAGQLAFSTPNSEIRTPSYWIGEIERRLEARITKLAQPSLRRVINATGVIIHTNLGRAPLARAALDALAEVASNYSNLEYDLSRGERGKRESHCRELLARLAGSEAAIIANNNAAAVLLVLNTLAEGGEVIVSRGELIEIGGSFRIPEVMEKSGARLCEVGTTNRTRISDYEQAINERTRLILRVHPSNYRIIGFTERPPVQQIAELAARAGVLSFEDLGSGCLIDLSPYGVKDEPVVKESLRAGIDVVSFSGDKMLGGPQAGIIAGNSSIIDRVRKNPLMRALRVDKITYAAIEATLRLYERGAAQSSVPVIRLIAMTREEIAKRAEQFARLVEQASGGKLKAVVEEGESVIGGGSAPEVKLPTALVAIRNDEMSASSIEERLRSHRVAIITRTERDRVIIDLRTVEVEEEAVILEAIACLAQPAPKSAASEA